MKILGIDVGGSGIKGAIVDVETGEMLTERHRISTPESRNPEDMANVVAEIVKHFDYKGKVGCGFPTVIKKGICKSPGNLDSEILGLRMRSVRVDRRHLRQALWPLSA